MGGGVLFWLGGNDELSFAIDVEAARSRSVDATSEACDEECATEDRDSEGQLGELVTSLCVKGISPRNIELTAVSPGICAACEITSWLDLSPRVDTCDLGGDMVGFISEEEGMCSLQSLWSAVPMCLNRSPLLKFLEPVVVNALSLACSLHILQNIRFCSSS